MSTARRWMGIGRASRTLWLAGTLVCTACGGERAPDAPESESASAVNHAPRIAQVEIAPGAPKVGDLLTLESSVEDPDGDDIELQVEWYVNREVQETTGVDFETSELKRGDEVYAILRASDGELEESAQAQAVRIGNSPPRVSAVKISPEPPDAAQTLVAEPTVQDADGDPFSVNFEWLVNGQPLAGANQATLEPGRVKRGDEVRVSVRASDEDSGDPFVSDPVRIGNARPRIVSIPPQKLVGGNRYEYRISAEDPDGDRPLRYTLVRGPEGMEVDLVSGVLEWIVPKDVDGKFQIEVAVRDAHGGESRQSYDVEFHWEAVKDKKSKPASADDE